MSTRKPVDLVKRVLESARDPEAVKNEKPHHYKLVNIRQQVFDQLALWKDTPQGNQWIIDLIKADPKAIEGLKELGFEKSLEYYGIIRPTKGQEGPLVAVYEPNDPIHGKAMYLQNEDGQDILCLPSFGDGSWGITVPEGTDFSTPGAAIEYLRSLGLNISDEVPVV